MLLAACNAIGHDGLLSRQRRTFMHASNLSSLLGFLLKMYACLFNLGFELCCHVTPMSLKHVMQLDMMGYQVGKDAPLCTPAI